MKRKYNFFITLGIVVVFSSILLSNQTKNSELEKYFCSEDEKKAEACIEIYSPVCGWSDPDKIKCFKFPCAKTYSNSCFSCINENVLYWTKGICPE